MSREEVAAKAICEWDQQYTWGGLGDESPMKALYEYAASMVTEALDAHDRANGIHRITIDDATVERAAKFLPHDQYCGGIYPCDCWQARIDTVRAVLAAAVKEES